LTITIPDPVQYYCPGSEGEPPSLMGHFAFFYCNNVYIYKVLCYNDAFRVYVCPLKHLCKGMLWLFLKICLVIKIDPEMPVLLIKVGHTFKWLFRMTEVVKNSDNICPALDSI
jgi:hypothetical protein